MIFKRITVTDAPQVSLPDQLVLVPHANLITGETAFKKHFRNITSLETDLLTFASAIYAADLGVLRGEREHFQRRFQVTVPVVNLQSFLRAQDDIAYVLYLLSNDTWDINFIQCPGTPEGMQQYSEVEGTTLLFSGGLDSLAMGVKLAEEGTPLQLVSHDSGNKVVKASQDTLIKYVSGIPGSSVEAKSFRCVGRNNKQAPYPTNHESSQRTRSLLFLTLGALVARRSGNHRVVFIAENGQMAIHLPLTASRIGAFSTHTAHPEVIDIIQTVLGQILNFHLRIENPFLYLTKSEVVADLCQKHPGIIPKSVSCWKASRIEDDYNHCGACIPCLVRRIALEYHNMSLNEMERDLLSEDVISLHSDDIGKRNLMELMEFVTHFRDEATEIDLVRRFPDIKNQCFDTEQAILMYKRFSNEARTVINRYEHLRRAW